MVHTLLTELCTVQIYSSALCGVLELGPGQRLVHVEEVDLAHHGGPGVAAAPGEGWLRVGDASLLELVPAAGDPAVDVEQEQAEAEQQLQPHGGCGYLK